MLCEFKLAIGAEVVELRIWVVLLTNFIQLFAQTVVHTLDVHMLTVFDSLRDHCLGKDKKRSFLISNNWISSVFIFNHPPIVGLIVLNECFPKGDAKSL